MRLLNRFALSICAGCLLAACAPTGALVSDDGYHRLVARDPQSGISVVLTTEAWDGVPANLDKEVTVIHALVANLGNTPIVLAPGDIRLTDSRGFRYMLLDAGGRFYAAEQPGTNTFYEYANDPEVGVIALENSDIASSALPWGVLQPGTQMRGFLYFQKTEATANAATLIWRLHTPDRRSVADLAFEFQVARVPSS